MVVKTEGQHQGEFLVSEGAGNISREAATLASGQNVVDGTVMAFSGSNLVALTDPGTAELAGADIAGIVYGNWDASGGAIAGVPYIARLAEVKTDLLTAPETITADELSAALAEKFIITRDS